ncbi:MAG: flagellar hook-length control protein FliK [Phycisphaerales bacterium]
MPTQTPLLPSSPTPLTERPKQQLRFGLATNAQGFAQVLQSFDTKSAPAQAAAVSQGTDREPVAQSKGAPTDEPTNAPADPKNTDEAESTGVQRDDPDADGEISTSAANGSDGQVNPTSQGDPIDQPGITLPTDQTQSPDAQQPEPTDSSISIDGQGNEPQPEQSDQSQLDSDFRVLQSQSEHAKLTIKGVERQLTHAADIDLAAQAKASRTLNQQVIETKLDSSGESKHGTVIKDDQSATPPRQSGSRNGASLPSTPPSSFESQNAGRTGHPILQSQRVEPHTNQVPLQVINSQPQTQSSIDTSASQAAAATQAATIPARQGLRTPQAQADPTQSTQRTSLQEIPGMTAKSITGIASGQLGTGSHSQSSGALTQGAQASQLPSETKRAGVLAQVQRGLASMLRSGKSEMTLKLTPGHLGELKIRVKSDGDRLSIRFEASTKEAGEYLKSGSEQLGSLLKSKGIEIHHIRIETPDTSSHNQQTSDTGSSLTDDSSNQPGQSHPDFGHDSSRDTPRQNQEAHSESPDQDPGLDGQAVWTELGLDAVA